MTQTIKGIVFDKDGTLFDFNATWGAWADIMLTQEAGGDPALRDRLALALGYDVARKRFEPGSLIIAEPVDVIAQHVLRIAQPTATTAADLTDLIDRMNAASAQVPQVAACDLPALMQRLRAIGLTLGIATNDAEAPARRHLAQESVLTDIAFVAGYDSGFGGKPAPGQLLAFCDATGLAAADCVMVGDSLHDLAAGRAAGMKTVGVLTGPADRATLEPHADAVLAHVGHLPDWIITQA